LNDQALVSYLLNALETTWLLADRYEDAVAFFSSYIAGYPNDAEAHRGRGAALWYLGRLQEAIPDYTRALGLKPDDFLSLCGRGQVLAEAGDSAKAMVDLDLALRLIKATDSMDPASAAWSSAIEAFARNGRALALSGIGDTAAAMNEFDRSIALCPDNAWVYHNRAQVHELSGHLTRASADYRQSLATTQPALSLKRKEHAEARLNALSNYS